MPYKGKYERSEYNRTDTPDESKYPARHPKHLKGREIGMYYAKKSRFAKEEARKRPIGSISITPKKREQIKSLLNETNLKDPEVRSVTHGLEHFFKNIQNFDKRLENSRPSSADADIDNDLKNELFYKRLNNAYINMQKIRERLPAYKKMQEIVQTVQNNQITIISGETGCGKTTQVAQFILDEHVINGRGSTCRIICTQPRRISAIAVAERVAEERIEHVGDSVGYHIRLESRLPRQKGSITFCTTGIILKQLEENSSLDGISHLILDEIHERDAHIDILLALVKKIIKKRSDLKLILMSATLNAVKFATYFEINSILEIPGFTYPVEEFYLEDVILRTEFEFYEPTNRRKMFYKDMRRNRDFDGFVLPHARKMLRDKAYPPAVCYELMKQSSEELNLDLIHDLIVSICETEEDEGAILVFLPGLADISTLNNLLENSKTLARINLLIIPLHSLLPTIEQKYIFKPAPSGRRKIILATNIAETSITIDDVVFVIDCGRIKLSNYDPETKQHTLLVEWEAAANANQRRGRAGRVKPGKCFYLFTRARKMLMDDYPKPEILRKRLEDVILMLKLLQISDMDAFLNGLIDRPAQETIDYSIHLLKRLNALDAHEQLTPLGYHLAKLPLAPQLGKMILLGAIFSCLDPILSIAACLDFKDPFLVPLGKEEQVNRVRKRLALDIKSDHLLLAEAMRRYEGANDPKTFCWENYLSNSTMRLLVNMKRQFAEYLYELNFLSDKESTCLLSNLNSKNTSLIKAIISAGLYPNVMVNRAKMSKRMRINMFSVDGKNVKLHPKTTLKFVEVFESPLIVFYVRIKSTSDLIHDGTMVHPLPLIFFSDDCTSEIVDGKNILNVGGLRVSCREEDEAIILELRKRLNAFLKAKTATPGFVNWHKDCADVAILKAIKELITLEDERFVAEFSDVEEDD